MGLLRALQTDILIFLAFVFGLFILRYAILLVIRWTTTAPAGFAVPDVGLRLWVNRLTFLALMIATMIFVWVAMVMATTNSIPRADIDRSGVYEQMKAVGR